MAKAAAKRLVTNASVFIRTDLYIKAKQEAESQGLSTSRFIAYCVEAVVNTKPWKKAVAK